MIGVFDSGYGGLTILRALIDHLPQYAYAYYGDNAHAPYGTKRPDEIYELTKIGVAYLFEQGAHIVILGCNTASAAALRRLQQEWLPQHYPDRRVLGIVVPTIEQITGIDWRHTKPITTPISKEHFTVGILATPATVISQAYPQEVHKRNPSIRVIQEACPGLVEAIEAKQDEEVQRLVQIYTQNLQKSAPNMQAVLLGCTHYALIADQIRRCFPENVKVYEQPEIVAISLAKYLMRNPEMVQPEAKTSPPRFFTTGDPSSVSQKASHYFEKEVIFCATL